MTLVVASVVISLGLAPVFGLTTEMIVGSAPPEKAGAASGSPRRAPSSAARSGSPSWADRRGDLPGHPGERLPASSRLRPPKPRETRWERRSRSPAQLPAESAATVLLAVARDAFVDGMHLVAAIVAVVGVGLAIFAYVTLRERGTERSETEPTCVEPTMIDQPVLTPLAKPARECF